MLEFHLRIIRYSTWGCRLPRHSHPFHFIHLLNYPLDLLAMCSVLTSQPGFMQFALLYVSRHHKILQILALHYSQIGLHCCRGNYLWNLQPLLLRTPSSAARIITIRCNHSYRSFVPYRILKHGSLDQTALCTGIISLRSGICFITTLPF